MTRQPARRKAPKQAAASHGHGEVRAGAAEAEPFTKSLERMNRFQERLARSLIADLELPAGSHGLDVGCGVGLYTLWLAEAVGSKGQVVGIEPTAERIAAALALVGGQFGPERIELRQGDGTALDMATDTFDWVWCGDVLHHILDTRSALAEFRRVVRPGGRIIVKESQVLSAMFLPGHPELERRIQLAEIERTLEEGGGRSFQERRQTTLISLRDAGLEAIDARTYLIERRAPLTSVDRDYIQKTVFDRNWGPRLRDFLEPDDWAQRNRLCDSESRGNILRSASYHCVYPVTVFIARVPK